ncbi:MAG: MFS transporter [Gammaproteobacteria bacterium]|nr:MFS transporter [Gammaproteobacteria bacterium]
MRPLNLYMAGTASWFVNHGIQGVMFAWLVTIVLRESPQMVGVAQMAMLLPALLFMLIGGSLADRFGGRRVAVLAQAFSVVPVLGLLVVIATDQLSFATMIGFAVLMGLAQAFVTPARDGLLNQVAEGRIQHTVVRATMIQFSAMLIAFVIVGQTDRVGPAPVIAVQALVLILGTIAMRRIPVSAPARRPSDNALWRDLSASVATGLVTVMRSAPMRMVAIQNVAIGMFFMGSYIVTIPVAVRDIYGGSAADLARPGADLVSADARGVHTPAATGAAAGAGVGGGGVGYRRIRFRLSRFRSLYLSVGRLRRRRHEHGAHDHAGAGALRPARPRDGVLFILPDGCRTVRRPAGRGHSRVVGTGQRPDCCHVRHAHRSRDSCCCLAWIGRGGVRPGPIGRWKARRDGPKHHPSTV